MASLGLCYAPDDSTLSQSWKGLIDCSAGILYYWNTETSVTQYENNLGCVQDSKLICHYPGSVASFSDKATVVLPMRVSQSLRSRTRML
ncbi:hypothetical protein KY290_020097 [Solanum tuberosum]|uniref:Uncharacterized protein n=1 Tax=Solanum tuberosum TaxID=4113 RepID=A0ABQ7VIZ7_SOLTU|nr:hypothetical protein KY284_025249 [Solanum tuberosum]KAH0691262.1 hypothetical protein KY289_018620 [Solanum tuberosum]KAH0764024.1 hypothetical protein KY290_020097 [Solanum tuberosum]